MVAGCRDGDPTCDTDGLVDRSCTFAVQLCVDVEGCEGDAVERLSVRGQLAPPVARSASALVYPVRGPVCTEATSLRVPLGRRARRRSTLSAAAVDAASGAIERDRLELLCQRAAAVRTAKARAVVVTTDFETGGLATMRVEPPHTVQRLDNPVHADAVVRAAGGRAFVINRFLGDNIDVFDATHGLRSVLQCSTVPGSNPHDLALRDAHKAYVTRYDRTDLWIVDPAASSCDGFRRGSIDLGRFADADGIPEMDQMALVGDRLFVSVQRLDRRQGFAPTGPSRLVVIDTNTDEVTGSIELAAANAFGDSSGIAREPGTGKLLVNEAGNIYRTGDGGIQRVDPIALVAEDFLITEDEIGGNITDFVVISPTKAYAVVITDALKNVLVAFDPSQHLVTRRLLTRTDYLPDIALGPDGLLWVADRNLLSPGIRIFDPADDAQRTAQPIDVGLPPFAIAFLP